MLPVNEIYHMDCFEFLDKIDEKIIDLAVIDPPYNLQKANWDTFKNHNEFLKFTYKWIDELIPKLKEDGSIYIFNTPFNSAYIMLYLIKKGLYFQNWITWDKRDGLSSAKRKYANGQETILFFTKSINYTFNVDSIREPYFSTSRILHATKKGILKNGKRWFPNPKGKLCGEVWHFSSERHKNKINGKTPKLRHLTPKPTDLIERIIKASSNKNDLILDCFIGSGTSAYVSKLLNRKYIGCDSNLEFVNLSKQRLLEGNLITSYDYIKPIQIEP